jgi:Zn finger protein HypA/HybF involved in hydrogenase expression
MSKLRLRLDILESKDKITEWIKEDKSKASICKELKCKPETLDSYLIKMGISYKGNRGAKGHKKSSSRKTAFEYLESTHIKSHTLKIKLIEDGVKKHECEECKLNTWNGKLIPLELHHVDGNRYNNSIENLQIICPNCHAQTPNYSGKNTMI